MYEIFVGINKPIIKILIFGLIVIKLLIFFSNLFRVSSIFIFFNSFFIFPGLKSLNRLNFCDFNKSFRKQNK